MAPSPIDYTNHHGGTHVRIFSHTFFKNKYFKIFWALSEGPRGPTPTFSNSSPRVTYPRIFSRLSTSILTKAFTHALPTSTATPTPTPSSDSPPRDTYPTIFFRLSTSSFTKAFIQALPLSTATPTTSASSDSPPRLTYSPIFPASLPQITPPPKRWNLTSNVTTTLKWSAIYRGDQHVAHTPYMAPIR